MSIEKDMQKRLEEIKEQAAGFRSGNISHEIYDTGERSSFASLYKAALKSSLIPLYEAKFKTVVEKILFVDIPVPGAHTSMLHLALPYSHAGLVSHEHPTQLSCATNARIPCTLIQNLRGYFTEIGEDDPLFKILRNDEGIKKLRAKAILAEQYADSDLRVKFPIEWILQVVPLDGSTLCVLNTGSRWEGILSRHRIYDLEPRLMMLEQVMEDVHKVGYSGEPKEVKLYSPVYQLMRRGFSSATHSSTGADIDVCTRCGSPVVSGAHFCGNCGQQLQR